MRQRAIATPLRKGLPRRHSASKSDQKHCSRTQVTTCTTQAVSSPLRLAPRTQPRSMLENFLKDFARNWRYGARPCNPDGNLRHARRPALQRSCLSLPCGRRWSQASPGSSALGL